jgi:hypothetical protein
MEGTKNSDLIMIPSLILLFNRPSAVPINLRVNSPMYRASHNRPTNWEKFKKD